MGKATYLSLEAIYARTNLFTLGIVYGLHICSRNNYSWTADYSLAGRAIYQVLPQRVKWLP